jgi:hypothetical protein
MGSMASNRAFSVRINLENSEQMSEDFIEDMKIFSFLQSSSVSKPQDLRTEKQEVFTRLCCKSSEISEREKKILVELLYSRLLSDSKTNKEAQEMKNRDDVTVKKLLRMARHFYETILDEELEFKKKKKRDFLYYTDTFV